MATLETIVLDNASTDATRQIVGRHPGVKLLVSDTNIGFAAAVNRCCADLAGVDYLFLLNPDVTLRPDTLDALLDLARACPDGGLYGGRMEDRAGRLNPLSCLALPSVRSAIFAALPLARAPLLGRLNPDRLAGWDRTGSREVPALAAAAVLIEAGLWRRLGGFDTRFFMYGEDVDLCVRARRAGARPMFTDRAVYRHLGQASARSRADFLIQLLNGKIALADLHLGRAASQLARYGILAGAGLRAAWATLLPGAHAEWREVWRRRTEWRHGWR